MSTLAVNRPTLIDVARMTDPNGKIGRIAEVLTVYNDLLDDIPWFEGNLPLGHQSTIETSKGNVALRLLNQGVVSTKGTTGQLSDACSILEARNEVDVDVAMINGNAATFRQAQDNLKIRSFHDALNTLLIYGDAGVDPAQFNGLATRYFTFGTTYTTSSQMIDADGLEGGTDNTSIYLVNWGEGLAHGIYPKGSQAGLNYEDRGIQDLLTNSSTGAYMRAYVSWFQWKCGIAIPDYRSVIRIANIDVSNLLTAGDSSPTAANLLKFMSMALDKLPPGMGNPVFYMNQTVRSMLRVLMNEKSNLHLTVENVVGVSGITRRPILTFQGVPCRRMDSILNTESTITTANT